MRIVISGAKNSGKSTIGPALAGRLGIPFVDLDDQVVDLAKAGGIQSSSCAEVYRAVGRDGFRALERQAAGALEQDRYMVLATGGSTLMDRESRHLLRPRSVWVYLHALAQTLWDRIDKNALPAYLENVDDPHARFVERVECIHEVVGQRCDLEIATGGKDADTILGELVDLLHQELAVRATAANTFGEVIRLTTFGESHGPMMGAVLDGVRPGLALSENDIQGDLDRRRPGQSQVATERKESDTVRIVSGVFEGKTTGAPIGMLIPSADSRSSHYEAFKDLFRPGHADYTFWQKYGIRDYRGGGRSSGRETASRVAGGAVARAILADRGVTVRAYTMQVGEVVAETVDHGEIERNPVRCPDPAAATAMEKVIIAAKEAGDSVGGIVQIEVTGLPAGLGDPVFLKLDARLGGAILSLGAIKGIEFGTGFACAAMRGSEHNDQMEDGAFLSNHAGGILGGISTGQPLLARVVVKPTASVSVKQKTVDIAGENRSIEIEGRHDPCIAPRIVPAIEAMVALTLLDAWEIQDRLRPGWCDKAR